MLRLVNAGDIPGSKSRAGDLEKAWDSAQPRLQPIDGEKWTLMDGAIDKVLKNVRAATPDKSGTSASLTALIAVIDSLDKPKTQ